MYSPAVTYGRIIRLANPIAKRNRNLRDLRNRYQYGMHHKATASFLSYYARDLELISGSDLFAAKKIYNRLCEAGNVVFIDVDAWPNINTVTYQRPFAGFKKRAFAMGAAQLARMAQSTIISCTISQENDGTIILEWGTPIRCMHNKPDDDINVMNILLDAIEVAVGEKPAQYALEIGAHRRWDPQSKQWKDLPD